MFESRSKPSAVFFASSRFIKSILLFLGCFLPVSALGQSISGTVQDPTGAVIVGAKIEITGGDLSAPVALSSDGEGKFLSSTLKPGSYVLRISREGFATVERKVELQTQDVQLEISLSIAQERTEVSVKAKHLEYANSDPAYRQLRNISFGDSFRFDNFNLQIDAATFHFEKGTVTLLAPVEGMVTGLIFIGEGHFTLKPVTSLDATELKRRAGASPAEEDFTEVVFRFSDRPHLQFLGGFGARVETPVEADKVFARWKEQVRHRRETPLGFTESILHGETMDNVDADLLSAIYNRRNHPDFINAYIHGNKHKDMRFFLRTRVGAVPQLDSPEEVGLINYDPEGMEDGIWYLDHQKSEFQKRTASSHEERRLFATHKYKIETVVAKNQHLFSTATITFQPLVAGERVLKFGLLPNLRVTRVTDDAGGDLFYIQESRKEDGSFYAILPSPGETNQEYSITVQYEGDKVLEQAGEGSFYVAARTSWYPNLNGFGERALYDLTYKVPHKYKVISVGELKGESQENEYAVTHWVTAKPVAVAGFNYGDYKKVELADDITGYKISGYYIADLPDNLRKYQVLQSMAPHKMTQYALEQTRAQLQLCTHYFGKSAYDEVYITEQPNFNFGQSWPNLVYLPISAYTDSTQRWMMFGNVDTKFTGFVQEVTPHEVAHQWWGHAVGWATYHDQWLSEGFAEFSAGLFLQQAMAGDWRKDYIDFWERLRKRILEKNAFGIAPNDAAPLWMGLRAESPRTVQAYQNVTYPKGAYVLQMLRAMMYDPDTQDKAFIDMMHDFVESYRDREASTEAFQSVAERHMTKTMDLAGDGHLNWFFDEWVYGTQVPRYQFEYSLSPADGGKTKLHMAITQSEVNERFAMLVPVFADFGKGMVRIGQAPVIGNSTRTADVILPLQPKKVALNVYKDVLER